MKETTRYVGPDGEALHPGDRIGLEPPGCLKRDDGLDALKIKNPEVQILGKDSGMILNVKGIGEAVLLAALFNAAKPDRDDMMYSQHESMTKEVASELLDELSGHKASEPVFIRKLYGRRIYGYFWPGMKQMDGTQYDNENGQGKAAEVVAALRREIAAKKNAERKAERAKRHRLAAYWMDGESHAQFVCSGGNAGEHVRVGAQLLASVIRKLPEKMRANAVSDAMTIVLQETKENGEADD